MNLAANHGKPHQRYFLRKTGPSTLTLGSLVCSYPTWKPSRRLRFPWGRNKPVKLGWVPRCQKEVEQLDEGWTFVLSESLESGTHGFWVRWFSDMVVPFRNPGEGFDKHGNEIGRKE